ncbi:BQ5605_C034g11324 [Microbotryum silenes-dioicae]|uniref:BQ5605_C034g11324 protein n=1 Tax=Microbotryum silenes-dioicae TaxID=796604 RepID=A0A2X0MGK0_9BASI|nr:BQ5605_C034g11324 [Microbotryum silenes-dioicae]
MAPPARTPQQITLGDILRAQWNDPESYKANFGIGVAVATFASAIVVLSQLGDLLALTSLLLLCKPVPPPRPDQTACASTHHRPIPVSITFKTLQQKQFKIEAQPTDTRAHSLYLPGSPQVLDLKIKIQAEQGFEVASQKIIFSGKILADDKTVADANFKEKDASSTHTQFCVVMVSKPKAAPAPAAAPSTSAASAVPATPAQASAPAVVPNAPAPAPAVPNSAVPETPSASTNSTVLDTVETPAVAGASTGEEASSSSDTSFLMGSALQSSINEMVSMGFPRDQVMKALKASFNNPHRAVEYLMTGIPESSEPAPGPAAAAAAGAPGTPSRAGGNAAPLASTPAPAAAAAPAAAPNAPPATTGAARSGAAGSSELAQLAQQPIFGQLRSLVQQNPALLQPFLQQLGASNPELLSIIDRNQAEFVRFLQEGQEGGAAGGEGLEGLLDQFGDDEEGEDRNEHYIQVTEEENQAIDRLTAMGFNREVVIQAYLACDRNEELAANYLLEHGFDDME